MANFLTEEFSAESAAMIQQSFALSAEVNPKQTLNLG
jgi:hypothetical protein